MTSTRCLYCSGPLVLVRADAKFCTPKCGTYYRRKASKAGSLPAQMTVHPRFVRYTSTKRPIMATTGKSASSTNSATWTDFQTASASTMGEGVGFVLGAGVGCLDLDHCFTNGVLDSWAADVVAANPNTFVEVSRSGEGLHLFGLLPEGPGRKIRDGRSIEVYSTGRYIALTANRFGSAPLILSPLVISSM